MADQWCDVSGYQRPDLMLWVKWGIPRGQYRLTLGKRVDPRGPLHRGRMRAALMRTGSYGVPVEYAPTLTDQAWLWIDNIPDDDENDDWVDAERAGLTEPMLSEYCDAYDQHSRRQRLAIYTGWPWWTSHVPIDRRNRYKGYNLIIASYPYDTPAGKLVPMDARSVKLRSNPPVGIRPAIHSPWMLESGWQHSGQASFEGYPGFLDAGIYRVNPGGTVPPPPPDPDTVVRARIHQITTNIRDLVGA